jgi:hypothetical protein
LRVHEASSEFGKTERAGSQVVGLPDLIDSSAEANTFDHQTKSEEGAGGTGVYCEGTGA